MRAHAIRDPLARKDALDSLTIKRDHAHGAALFSVLPRKKNRQLLRLLVAYQTLWDYLDTVSERCLRAGEPDERHRALVDALDSTARVSSYGLESDYNDGGYLHALVKSCQANCGMLPSYAVVRPFVLAGVARCAVQSLNHDPIPERRERALKRWADFTLPNADALMWFEKTAAASAYLPHPLLALACDANVSIAAVTRTEAAYFPWVSLAIAMLDSYVDQADDRRTASHSYVAYYGQGANATNRIAEIVRRATCEMTTLSAGSRHTIVVAAMVAMYLSKKEARATEMQAATRQLLKAGGLMSEILMPQVRVWRVVREGQK